MLSAPVTRKSNVDGIELAEFQDPENAFFIQYGASSMQGWRRYQEDRFSIFPMPSNESKEMKEEPDNIRAEHTKGMYVFSVFDGHGGSVTAEYCEKHFNNYLITRILENEEQKKQEKQAGNKINSNSNINIISKSFMEQAFLDFDHEHLSSKAHQRCGCTAMVCLLDLRARSSKPMLYSMHIGDTRMLVFNARKRLLFASRDHNPDDPTEMNRIVNKAQATLVRGRIHSGIGSSLNVCRAFGDQVFKKNESIPRKDQAVTAQCDFHSIDLSPLLDSHTKRVAALSPSSSASSSSYSDSRAARLTNSIAMAQDLADRTLVVYLASDGIWKATFPRGAFSSAGLFTRGGTKVIQSRAPSRLRPNLTSSSSLSSSDSLPSISSSRVKSPIKEDEDSLAKTPVLQQVDMPFSNNSSSSFVASTSTSTSVSSHNSTFSHAPTQSRRSRSSPIKLRNSGDDGNSVANARVNSQRTRTPPLISSSSSSSSSSSFERSSRSDYSPSSGASTPSFSESGYTPYSSSSPSSSLSPCPSTSAMEVEAEELKAVTPIKRSRIRKIRFDSEGKAICGDDFPVSQPYSPQSSQPLSQPFDTQDTKNKEKEEEGEEEEKAKYHQREEEKKTPRRLLINVTSDKNDTNNTDPCPKTPPITPPPTPPFSFQTQQHQQGQPGQELLAKRSGQRAISARSRSSTKSSGFSNDSDSAQHNVNNNSDTNVVSNTRNNQKPDINRQMIRWCVEKGLPKPSHFHHYSLTSLPTAALSSSSSSSSTPSGTLRTSSPLILPTSLLSTPPQQQLPQGQQRSYSKVIADSFDLLVANSTIDSRGSHDNMTAIMFSIQYGQKVLWHHLKKQIEAEQDQLMEAERAETIPLVEVDIDDNLDDDGEDVDDEPVCAPMKISRRKTKSIIQEHPEHQQPLSLSGRKRSHQELEDSKSNAHSNDNNNDNNEHNKNKASSVNDDDDDHDGSRSKNNSGQKCKHMRIA